MRRQDMEIHAAPHAVLVTPEGDYFISKSFREASKRCPAEPARASNL